MRPFTVTVSDASGGAKDSKAVVLDYYGRPEVAIQVVVSGTVNYTVQQTLDNPLESSAPITWFDCTDTGLVGQTASKIGGVQLPPVAVRIRLNSGTGSVTMTALQAGLRN